MKKSQKKFILKSIKKSIYTKSLMGFTISLSGCMGVYEGGFECPPGEGVGCKSISEVNYMVDQGLGNNNPPSETDSQKIEDNESVCKKGSSGSCPISPEIWYAPGFEVIHNEKCQTQDLDDALSL